MHQRRERGEALVHQREASLGDLVAAEGLDDELVRQCSRLLAEDDLAPRPVHGATADPHTLRRARRHLLIARLAFETQLLDRAGAHVDAALELTPDDETTLRLLAAIHHRRGRLSEAIAIWQQIAAQTTPEQSALRHLAQVFELSLRDPADRARFMPSGLEAALGGALPDLEESFRRALAQDVPGAVRAVERALVRYRSRDRHLFKVAAIQRAWLLEQTGDVRGAIATLERLADEPGLTNDVERLLCLSMLYEREGTPERFRRAIRAVRHAYLQTREPTLLRRLARLLAQLGHVELADLLEARYLEIFRRRMHGLSVRELSRAAAAAYVPTDRLRALPYPPGAVARLMERHLARRRPLHRRRAAVLALVQGDAARALHLLRELDTSGHATPVDLLYLGEAEELAGHAGRACEARARALVAAEHPDAIGLISLLGKEEAPADSVLGSLAKSGRLEEAARSLRAHARAHPSSPEAWRALARAEMARGREEAALDHHAHAQALRDAPPHAGCIVLAAAAVRRGGLVRGLMHEIWVEARPGRGDDPGGLDAQDVLGAVTPELRAYAVNVFHGVRAFARARFPHRAARTEGHRFVVKFTKDDEPSSGDSAGLPMAVAFLASMLGLRLPPEVAYSGAVVCDAHDVVVLRRVGDVEAKVEGAYERRLRRLYLPEDNRPDVERAERVPREIASAMVRYAATLEAVCDELFAELA